MCAFVRGSSAQHFIIVTELGIIHRLKKENPAAEYIPVTQAMICPNMKLTSLEDVLRSLETLTPEITVPEDTRRRAELPIRRMLAGRLGLA
jgi:quinolinate synthase